MVKTVAVMKLFAVIVLMVASTGIAHGWAGSASYSYVNMYRWSCRTAFEAQSAPNIVPSIFSAVSMRSSRPPSPSNMANKKCTGAVNDENLCLGRDVLSRRSAIFLSLPLIFAAAASASADVQLTYGSGSFSGSSVVNGVLSAYGLPQLPDTKGFTPFLSQYQVFSQMSYSYDRLY
jgi:hypothetical protein